MLILLGRVLLTYLVSVPAFYRWLSRKYPKIISSVIEERPVDVDGVEYPADYSNPNPNGELDNLYLDMNGIVHPCTHPEGRPAPETEDEMMVEVFRYTDNVLSMARPRKILMIAVDGVAPRAKMNQQRSRRFRAAQDAQIESETKAQALADAEARGEIIDEAIKGKRRWDSNVITPGTPFMTILAKSIRYWIAYKLNNDPGWKNLKVIISDATVPGEGEHKIMEFIRSQRADPTYDPNTSHCIYGLDADLIFLGLATHEPHFKILREDVFASGRPSKAPANYGITSKDQERLAVESTARKTESKPFIWLHIDILRQYLEIELFVPNLAFSFDFERAIDDWVFMCFFVGNDFLPHLPSLDVRDHSIDRLTNIWKRTLNSIQGYMTCDGNVKLDRVEKVLKQLGNMEDDIFRQQKSREHERDARAKRLKTEQSTRQMETRQMEDAAAALRTNVPAAPAVSKNRGERAPIQPLDNMPLYSPSGESVGNIHMSNSDIVKNRNAISMANMANKSAAEQLRAQLLSGNNVDTAESTPNETPDETPVETPSETPKDLGIEAVHDDTDESSNKRKAPEPVTEMLDLDSEDPIQLGAPGYRERYYSAKLHVPMSEVDEVRRDIVKKYIEGVCWVLLYYYQGCASWNWYFPYHYAPFAADFVDLGQLDITFNKGSPFRPYEQLMSVLPAASNHTLPKVFRSLMSDPDSDIIDFYPENFSIDMNGKKMAWQGIALLPFIDETRLLAAVQAKYPELTDDETYRNTNQKEFLMIGRHNVMYENCCKKLYGSKNEVESFKFEAKDTLGLAGIVMKDVNCIPDGIFTCPINTGGFPDIENDGSLSLRYDMPEPLVENKSMLRPGVKLLPLVLTQGEENSLRDRRRGPGKPNYNAKTPSQKAESASDRAPGARGGYHHFVALEAIQSSGIGRYNDRNNYSDYTSYGGSYQNQNHDGGNDGRYNGQNSGYRGGYNDSQRGGYNGGQTGGYNGGRQGGYNNYQSGGYNNSHNSGYNNSYNGGGGQYQREGGYGGGGYNDRNQNDQGGQSRNNRGGYSNNYNNRGRGGSGGYRGGGRFQGPPRSQNSSYNPYSRRS